MRFEVFPPSGTLTICCCLSFGLLLRGTGNSLAGILRDEDFLRRLTFSLLDIDSGLLPLLPRLSLDALLRAAELDVSNEDRIEDRVLGFGDLDFDKPLCLSRLFRGGKDSSLLVVLYQLFSTQNTTHGFVATLIVGHASETCNPIF